MANDDLITTGLIPVDLSDAEEWLGGPTTYEIGENTFRVDGIKPAKGGKKGVNVVLMIIEGHEKNVGRTFTRPFDLGDKAKGFFKGFCVALAGPNALRQGQANIDALVGCVFKAPIYTRAYTTKEGDARTGYDINFKQMEVLKKGKSGGGGGKAMNFAPAE